MGILTVSCSACGKLFAVDERKAGQSSPCPACHARVDIPEAAPSTASPPNPTDPLPTNAVAPMIAVAPATPTIRRPSAPPLTINPQPATLPTGGPDSDDFGVDAKAPQIDSLKPSISAIVSILHPPFEFLLDFRRYWTPRIVRVVWIGAIVIAAAYVGHSFTVGRNEPAVSAEGSWRLLIFPPIASVLIAVVWLCAVRVVCEFLIVAFNVAETLSAIRERLDLDERP